MDVLFRIGWFLDIAFGFGWLFWVGGDALYAAAVVTRTARGLLRGNAESESA